MRSMLIFAALAGIWSATAESAQAQYAGGTDYEYVVMDPDSAFQNIDGYQKSGPATLVASGWFYDYFYDFEVYYHSGWWRLLEVVDTQAEAQAIVDSYWWTGLDFEIRAVYTGGL